MSDKIYYRVGGHVFALEMPRGLLSEKELGHYAPFLTTAHGVEELLFTLSLTDSPVGLPCGEDEIIRIDDENGRMELYGVASGGIAVHLSTPVGTECARIGIGPGYRYASALITGTSAERRYALDTVLMLLYAFASAPLHTLLFHASVVEYAGRGYLFLGKSGTGKSTHSRLWLENIPGVRLLNDDNPVIRISRGEVRVYGSPWSGKTPCYLDRSLPVGAIVRLSQGPRNEITRLPSVRAYAALLPSCSYMKWDSVMGACVHRTLAQIVGGISVYGMACLPDCEAARMCKETVTS